MVLIISLCKIYNAKQMRKHSKILDKMLKCEQRMLFQCFQNYNAHFPVEKKPPSIFNTPNYDAVSNECDTLRDVIMLSSMQTTFAKTFRHVLYIMHFFQCAL